MLINERDWVKTITVSMPDYANELAKNIEVAMTNHTLSDVDAHACALAAALASNNGELAFEISMSKHLFGNDIRETVAKAVIFENTNESYISYVHAAKCNRITVPHHGLSTDDFGNNGGATQQQFTMFCLVVAIVNRFETAIVDYIHMLEVYGLSTDDIDSVAKIAMIIPSINKCLI